MQGGGRPGTGPASKVLAVPPMHLARHAGTILSGVSRPEQTLWVGPLGHTDAAPNQHATGDRKCDLCATEEGELVPTSAEWRNALWVAEKHIVTWVQPMVQSPILARHAAAAYRLRQKPLGICCKVPAWVWGHHKNPPTEGAVLEPIGHVWPTLGEAAITGPQYFFEDFGAHEVEEPWGQAKRDASHLP